MKQIETYFLMKKGGWLTPLFCEFFMLKGKRIMINKLLCCSLILDEGLHISGFF